MRARRQQPASRHSRPFSGGPRAPGRAAPRPTAPMPAAPRSGRPTPPWAGECCTWCRGRPDQIYSVQGLSGGAQPRCGRVAFVTDNAAPHKPELIQKSTGGGVVPTCLPPCAPQLSPTGVQWRMIEARLAGRYYSTEDEMEHSIMRPAGSGEVHPSGYPTYRSPDARAGAAPACHGTGPARRHVARPGGRTPQCRPGGARAVRSPPLWS